jgi:hypothetical protein
VYNSITATRLAVLCDSQAGWAPASGRQVIANAKPTAPHIVVVLRILRVPALFVTTSGKERLFFRARGFVMMQSLFLQQRNPCVSTYIATPRIPMEC